MLRRLLPVLYGLEFLIALIAVFTVWEEVGGQNHLDYMAWYWKGGIGIGAAATIVLLTAACASTAPSRRWRISVCALVLAILAISAGVITYYYHVNEPPDDQEDAPATVTPTARHSPSSADGLHLV
jgi:glucan phosphoethanolaminetransferase (alkaline phosphatase superfamily)